MEMLPLKMLLPCLADAIILTSVECLTLLKLDWVGSYTFFPGICLVVLVSKKKKPREGWGNACACSKSTMVLLIAEQTLPSHVRSSR